MGQIWYRKKVSDPVLELFGTRTECCCQNLEILKIYNGNRYRVGTGTRNIFFLVLSEPVSEKSGTGKSPESVSLKFGMGKKSRNRYRKNSVPKKGNVWYRNKVSVSVSFNILGTVTHC